MEIQYFTNDLEQIARDLVSGNNRNASGLSATSRLEQEIELTLEELRKLREQELDKPQFDSFRQPECCASSGFGQADCYTPQYTDSSAYSSYSQQPNHNEPQQRPYAVETEQNRDSTISEDQAQRLRQKLISLLEKHKQSRGQETGDYWTGRMGGTLSSSAMK